MVPVEDGTSLARDTLKDCVRRTIQDRVFKRPPRYPKSNTRNPSPERLTSAAKPKPRRAESASGYRPPIQRSAIEHASNHSYSSAYPVRGYPFFCRQRQNPSNQRASGDSRPMSLNKEPKRPNVSLSESVIQRMSGIERSHARSRCFYSEKRAPKIIYGSPSTC